MIKLFYKKKDDEEKSFHLLGIFFHCGCKSGLKEKRRKEMFLKYFRGHESFFYSQLLIKIKRFIHFTLRLLNVQTTTIYTHPIYVFIYNSFFMIIPPHSVKFTL
jgi:hypothetical protein